MTTLAVVVPNAIAADGDQVAIPDKLLTGLEAYARLWSGDVALFAGANRLDTAGNLGTRTHSIHDLAFEVVLEEDIVGALSLRRPDVASLPLYRADAFLGLARRSVVVTENPAMQSFRSTIARGVPPIQVLRVAAGSVRRLLRYRSVVRAADGIQCNGWPAWDAFSPFSRSPMRFFDTRLSKAHVEAARAARSPYTAGPLRLGFSGRFSAEKGPTFAIEAVRLLNERGMDVSLAMFGDGPQLSELKASAPSNVTFRGSLPFDPEWTERVPKEVDVMVLPHVQGDPAGTYLESMGLGVPVVGFDNVMLASLVDKEHLGWSVPMRNTRSLADEITRLASDPDLINAMADEGFRFMAEHSWEQEFERRVAHLERIARR